MSKLNERLSIHDICREFEWEKEHLGKVLIVVEPGFGRHSWVIRMGATGFSSDGTFSKEVSRTVIFGKSGLKKAVTNVLEDMYGELYDE